MLNTKPWVSLSLMIKLSCSACCVTEQLYLRELGLLSWEILIVHIKQLKQLYSLHYSLLCMMASKCMFEVWLCVIYVVEENMKVNQNLSYSRMQNNFSVYRI